MNFAHQTAYLRKKLYKNNMIDDVSLLPDNNKDDRECVKFSRISSQEPKFIFWISYTHQRWITWESIVKFERKSREASLNIASPGRRAEGRVQIEDDKEEQSFYP